MKKALRSISSTQQPRYINNNSFDQESHQDYHDSRDNQYIHGKLRTNASTDRRIQFISHQNHPFHNASVEEIELAANPYAPPQNEYSQRQLYEKPQIKRSQLVKFEEGKLVKQVQGNQSIKGLDNNNIKNTSQQLRKPHKLPSFKTQEQFHSQQNQSLDRFVDKRDVHSSQRNNVDQQNYANIDYLLSSISKTQKEKNLENVSSSQKAKAAQRIRRKDNDDLHEKSLIVKSDYKSPNRMDDSMRYNPSRAVKTEQYDEDFDFPNTYSNHKFDENKMSPIKKSPLAATVSIAEQMKCPAKKEMNPLDTKLKQFLNQYDEYYKHVKGECLCTRCTCGGCKCDAKEPKIDKPMKQNKTNYELNYTKKPSNTDKLRFDPNNYANELIPKDSKFMGTTTQKTDYQIPSQADQFSKFVPKDNLGSGPAVQWVTSYNRNYVNFGNVPTFYHPKGNDRTTTDKMKFIDGTTYDRFYNKKDTSPQRLDPILPQGSLEYALRNAKPLMGETTNNHFYKPYNVQGREKKWEQKDHILCGAPTYTGQFDTNNNKEFGEKTRICPAKVEKQELIQTRREKEKEQFLNSQKELNIDQTAYGNISINYK